MSLDDLHGDTVVSRITISCSRSGAMKVEGSITDYHYAMAMLKTAEDVVRNYHNRATADSIIVPAHDTALVGTDSEKRLLAARDELSNAMAG